MLVRMLSVLVHMLSALNQKVFEDKPDPLHSGFQRKMFSYWPWFGAWRSGFGLSGLGFGI